MSEARDKAIEALQRHLCRDYDRTVVAETVDRIITAAAEEAEARAAETYEQRIAELEETCLLLGIVFIDKSDGTSDQETRLKLLTAVDRIASRILAGRDTEPPPPPED